MPGVSSLDKALTIEQTAYRYGYKDSFVRSACERSPEHHPLPHIKRGTSRPVRYIQPTTFEKWLEEEERLTVGLTPDEEAAKSAWECLVEMRKAWEKFEEEYA